MSFSFFPKHVDFFRLFEQQNDLLKEAVKTLYEIFKEQLEIPERCDRINRLEAEGDALSREISLQLFQTFITPLDREDIHDINIAQEELLNSLRSISTRFGLHSSNTIMEKGAMDLIEDILGIIQETSSMLHSLNGDHETAEQSLKARDIHNEAKLRLMVASNSLYEKMPETPTDILHIMKWTQMYDRIEHTLERAATLAGIIEGVNIKNA